MTTAAEGVRRRRRRALLGSCGLAGVAVAAILLAGAGRGPGGQGGPGTDIGDQSDAAALGQTVEDGLGDAPEAPSGGERGTTCGPETRATYGRGLGSMVYTARLRWQGAPAVALAYRVREPGGGPLDHRLFVVSREGCQLLVTQSL